ncbi:hypothetical protein C7E12_21510, partial [Stenotrophomonas maltophilia]
MNTPSSTSSALSGSSARYLRAASHNGWKWTARYTRRKIDRAGLLRYLVSYREHAEFHEQCVERIFSEVS